MKSMSGEANAIHTAEARATHGQSVVAKSSASERMVATSSAVKATPDTRYMVPPARPLMGQAATWLGRQMVCGQAAQLGAPLFGLGHTASWYFANGPPSLGGEILTVAEVWLMEPAFTSTDQLRGRGRQGGRGGVGRDGGKQGRGFQGWRQSLVPAPRHTTNASHTKYAALAKACKAQCMLPRPGMSALAHGKAPGVVTWAVIACLEISPDSEMALDTKLYLRQQGSGSG